MSYLKDFQTQVANHNYTGFLKLWEEYCAGDEVDPEELIAILRLVKGSEIGEPFGRHVDKIIPLWQLLQPVPSTDEIIRLILDIQTTNSEELALIACEHLQKKYGTDPLFQDRMRLIGLRNKEKFQGAISHYELLVHMKKGNFVFHGGGWGVGEINDVSLLREQLSVEFEGVPGKKELSFATAFRTLVPLAPDHFLARRFGNPDKLEEEAKENPVAVIHLLLRDLGPKTALELKEELCEWVIPAEDWVRWWQTARMKMKKDKMIDVPEDARQAFSLRSQELSHEERLKPIFEKKSDLSALIGSIYSFLKDFPETLKKNEFKNELVSKIKTLASHTGLAASQELQLLFLLEDLNALENRNKISELIQKISDFESFINAMGVMNFKKKALVEIKKEIPTWKEIFIKLLFTVNQAVLRDYLFAELISVHAEQEVKQKLLELCANPAKHPEVFIWYFLKVMSAKPLLGEGPADQARCFEGLLILLAAIENNPDYRELVKKIHGMITDGRFALVRKIMQEASFAVVKEIILLATKCYSFNDHDLKIFHSLAEVAHPGISKGKKKEEQDQDVIWTTLQGYQLLQQRMQQIATTETVQNAKEIEIARSYGDLRENAEFKAALEKRDRLQGELKMLSKQFNSARVLSKEDVVTDVVGVGTVVECKNPKGDLVSYTLLGPWDADPAKNILSFQSKLAQMMTGKKVGDTFQFQNEEYTVMSIKSAL